ncbi:MAG TPA: hypothetical protein VIK41_00785 [Gemmatimonadaceae bacterium]|jgi:hypothetical protein
MPQQIGASSGATDLSNGVGSSLQSVADDVRATMKALADLDAEHRAAHQAAAARAMASCGVRCEDAVWVTECAWCNRMRSVAGDWQTLAPAVRAAMKIERTHGVCPQCAQGLMARAERADREAR